MLFIALLANAFLPTLYTCGCVCVCVCVWAWQIRLGSGTVVHCVRGDMMEPPPPSPPPTPRELSSQP